jgi:hypothetical protein
LYPLSITYFSIALYCWRPLWDMFSVILLRPLQSSLYFSKTLFYYPPVKVLYNYNYIKGGFNYEANE